MLSLGYLWLVEDLYTREKLIETKVLMQGKLIVVVYTSCVHIETSSLWAEFVNNNICVSVRLVSEEEQCI